MNKLILRRLERTLQWVEAGAYSDARAGWSPGCGICKNVGGDAGQYLREAYASWPEYTGIRDYPVPSCTDSYGPVSAYGDNSLPKWSGKYGEARVRLLKHCIEYFKEKTA